MKIREQIEQKERETLSPLASFASNSKGRKEYEEKCNIRTDFQRDRDRIIHSKAFRRLKHKTQVFISPSGDHFRTRLTHTLEVAQIARTIARSLNLNEDLAEAISLGHDLGHTPFGHTGESILDNLNPNGFKHYQQSLRVVDILEHTKSRKGLNLTYEVREGIINHSGASPSSSLEGQVVKLSDRIAYINHDIDDAIRAGIIHEKDLPKGCIEVLGNTNGKRINNMIMDIVKESLNKKSIKMSHEIQKSTEVLRDFMFENVYYNKIAKSEEGKAQYIIKELYNYYIKNPNEMPVEYQIIDSKDSDFIEDKICDYIAGMTDRYAIHIFENIFIPKPWEKY